MRTFMVMTLFMLLLNVSPVPTINKNTQNQHHLKLAYSQTPLEVKKAEAKSYLIVLNTKKSKPLVAKKPQIAQVIASESNAQTRERLAREAEQARIKKELAAYAKVKRYAKSTYKPRIKTYRGSYPYWDLIQKYASLYGLNPNLMVAIMMAESGGNPSARNRSSGASGLFQFLPSTWRSWGIGSPFDPEANICAAAKLMAKRGTAPWRSSVRAWG